MTIVDEFIARLGMLDGLRSTIEAAFREERERCTAANGEAQQQLVEENERLRKILRAIHKRSTGPRWGLKADIAILSASH